MKNKNHILYYNKLKSLFPRIDYREGRFLRDMKKQLKEFSMCHPNCSYQEIEDTFGKVEDVVYDYVQEQGMDTIYESVRNRKKKKVLFILLILGLILSYMTYSAVWLLSYRTFSETAIETKEIQIDQGENEYEE